MLDILLRIFLTIILKGFMHYYCTFYKILLICVEMAGSEIQVSRHAASNAEHLLNSVPNKNKTSK